MTIPVSWFVVMVFGRKKQGPGTERYICPGLFYVKINPLRQKAGQQGVALLLASRSAGVSGMQNVPCRP